MLYIDHKNVKHNLTFMNCSWENSIQMYVHFINLIKCISVNQLPPPLSSAKSVCCGNVSMRERERV